jgi:RNA-directed DNA polymerase
LKEYWEKRSQRQIADFVPSKQKMAKKQDFICPVCSQSLFNGEELHTHHIVPVEAGGEEKYRNLLLVHEDCHNQIHSSVYRAKAIKKSVLAVSHLLEPDVM